MSENHFFISVKGIEIKRYDKLDEALRYADIGVDWGCRSISVYECSLAYVVDRGASVTKKAEPVLKPEELPPQG
jgi:hypothetical protein